MRSTLSLFHLAKEKGHRVREMGVLSAVEHIFDETAMHARVQASDCLEVQSRQSKSWSKSEPSFSGKGKSIENNEDKSKRKSKGTKGAIQGAKGSRKGKTSRIGLSGLENSKSETSSETEESAQTCPTDNSWIHDGWNDDWSSVGWHEGCEQTYDNPASSFSLGGVDLGATSSPKRFEWVKMNLDTGAAVNTFPSNFGPDGAGDGRFYRTASGEWIPDGGAW